MSKFNMMDLLNNSSKKAVTKEKENVFRTIQINIKDIIPSKRNFYSMEEGKLRELKDSILVVGLQQNLVVRKIDNGKYELITGHRRFLALTRLYQEGIKEYEYVPCKVEEEDDVRNKLRLIMTNSTVRELADWEKIQQAQELKELLLEYKKREKLPGRVRDIVADILNTSATQIARMESISKNLSEEFKGELKEEKVNFSTAYEISKLDDENQKEVFEEYKDKGNVTIKDVKKKKEIKVDDPKERIEVLEGQVTVEETLGEEVKIQPVTIQEEEKEAPKLISCDFCSGFGVETEEGGLVMIYDKSINKVVLVSTKTGEVEHITLRRCPTCGEKLG